jgi:hypothetical protein
MAVLSGLSLRRWMPTILIIEDNHGFSDRGIARHLAEFGYVAFRRTGVNDWYAQKDNRALVTPGNQLRYGMTWIATRIYNALFQMARAIVHAVPGARGLYRRIRKIA